jgi:hypothetical protein
MNTVLIVFLVLVILFAILYVVQVFNPSYMIRDSVPLNLKTRGEISKKLIEDPTSARYYYQGWLYIDANQPVVTGNVLFNHGKNFVVALVGSTLNVYTGLTNDVNPEGVISTTGLRPLISIPNFPFQKWTFLAIHVDGKTVDLYIDGKLIKTVNSPSFITTNIDDTISYGNHYTLGRIARFKRVPANISPQGVWKDYMLGSGQGYSVSNYHVNAQITKNKQITVDQRLI